MKVNINIEKKEIFVFHYYIILVCKIANSYNRMNWMTFRTVIISENKL